MTAADEWADEVRNPMFDLTPRELEVARLVADGMTNTQIAERLHLSSRTVTVQVGRLYRKAGVEYRAEFAKWAKQRGVTAPDTGPPVPDQIRGPSRDATADIIARFANAGRDDPTIAARLGISAAQVRGLREEFSIPPGETRWSHGHERPRDSAEAESANADAIGPDERLAHAVRMRNVHKAVGYDVQAETARIAEIRAQIRARDAK